MERLDELIANLKDLDARLDALLNNDTLTPEQRTEHDALQAEREKLVGEVGREQQRVNREQERAKLEADAAEAKQLADDRRRLEEDRKKLEEDRRARDEERSRRLARPSHRITDPDLPQGADARVAADAIPATVKRFGTLKNFKGTRNGRDAEQRAYRFGMWVLSRLAADMPNRYRFAEATQFVNRQMAAVTTSDGSGYQFLIPEEFGNDLIDLREVYGVARRLLKNVPMNSDTRTDPRRQSGLTAYFVAEAQPGTESNKVWNDVRLTAKDLMVLSRYTNQVAADAVINVGDDLAGEIAYAFAAKEDQCAFNGDGTSTYGGIVGFRTKLDSIDGAGTDSAGLVTQATSNTWPAITLADFSNVLGKLPQYAVVGGNVVWVASRPFYFSVMQRLELAAGGTTIMEISQGGIAPRPLFMGYPVEISQAFPIVTATTGVMLLLGNFNLAASFGDRQQNSIAFSEHATIGGENVFERNQIAIRGTERFDINVHDVGDATTPGPVVGLKTG